MTIGANFHRSSFSQTLGMSFANFKVSKLFRLLTHECKLVNESVVSAILLL